MLLKTTCEAEGSITNQSCSSQRFVKRHLKTALFCFVSLVLFACSDVSAPVRLSELGRAECVTRTNTPDYPTQDDSVCDIDDDSADHSDDSFQAKQNDPFATLPTEFFSISHLARYIRPALANSSVLSLDVSCIPNRAPPVLSRRA